ncbi:MAG: hypothetical protein ABWY06_16845 [Pseudomonas sp.]|uniref:hypothetical protein n=1 Tax=Pseudomonas sp. TaxID=306 RepID=UPI00339AA074
MNKILTLIFSCMFCSNLCAGAVEDQLLANNLTLKAPPTGGITGSRFDKFNSYSVIKSGDGLQIAARPKHAVAEEPVSFTMNGYRLEGINRGEWGGQLSLTGPDQIPVILSNENIVTIFQYQDAIYILSGLAHMGANNGTLYTLKNIETRPTLETVTLLPSAPITVTTSEQAIYILTYDGLVSIDHADKTPTMRILVHNAPWERFAPNSLVRIGNQFWIGMHSGVAVVTDRGYAGAESRFYGQ